MAQMITVKDHSRHTKRKMYDALGNDLIKILTELITNSDDSYRRLSKHGNAENGQKPVNSIQINVFKKEKRIEVIDNAEGMSEKDIENNFKSYGADKSGRSEGHKIRGLFGQGASDVLFTQEKGKIVSIKNNKIISADFYWEGDERIVSVNDNLSIDNIRKEYGIANNGTIVSFNLNEKTTFVNKLSMKLSNFYMLRFVMSDKNRSIYLTTLNDDGKPKDEVRLHYNFPPVNEGDELYNNEIEFMYEGKKVTGSLVINQINKKAEKVDKFGELRLLIHDNENNIYDNSFFVLGDKHPGMEHMHGFLKLNDTADIIREKLNQEMPEEILTDSREGLNKKHEFYKALNDKIEPILLKLAEKINSGEKKLLKSDDFKEHKQMFKELNKYLNEELDEINDTGSGVGVKPPAEGIAFVRDRIKITLGKKYVLKLLVNPLVVPSGVEIDFDCDNDNCISINPKSLTVDYDKEVGDIIFYNIVVDAKMVTENDCCLTAKIHNSGVEKKIFISVVNEEIYYPKYGMEFKPNYLATTVNHEAKLKLYVDLAKYPIGSIIKFSTDNQKIILKETDIVLAQDHVVFENVARVEVVVNSIHNNTYSKVMANCKNHIAEADVAIVDSIENNPGKSGLINSWKFVDSPEAYWQKYLNPKSGDIIINSGNIINKYYFGDEPDKQKAEGNKVFQRYLAELIADEVAKFIVKKQIENGHVGREYEEAIEEHQKRKNKVAAMVYKFIAT